MTGEEKSHIKEHLIVAACTKDDNIAKVLFMAVIPEVLNRESILFRKLRAPGFPPSPTVGALSTGMATFYEFIKDNLR